jgi:sigma-E factor negative regulatory protein RseC
MAIEQGIVIRMGKQGAATAWVKTVRSSACESCASKDHCNPGHASQEQEVEAINPVGARVGDRIQLAIHTGLLLKAMFLIYIFPILCMLAGGIGGDLLAPHLNADPSTASVVAALTCFGAALIVVRIGGQRMGGRADYRPKIIRILSREALSAAEGGSISSCDRQTLGQG